MTPSSRSIVVNASLVNCAPPLSRGQALIIIEDTGNFQPGESPHSLLRRGTPPVAYLTAARTASAGLPSRYDRDYQGAEKRWRNLRIVIPCGGEGGDDARRRYDLRSLFSYIDLENRIRPDHPLRVIRAIANAALKSLSGEFENLYSPLGRESIPPERLMRPSRPSIRSTRSGNWSNGSTMTCCSAGFSGWDRGPGMGCHDVHQEPRSAARRRYRGAVSRRGTGARQGQGVVVERAFLGSRHLVGCWKPGRA
jgi:hypothetical protein